VVVGLVEIGSVVVVVEIGSVVVTGVVVYVVVGLVVGVLGVVVGCSITIGVHLAQSETKGSQQNPSLSNLTVPTLLIILRS